MKKYCACFVLLIVLLTAGCVGSSREFSDKISPPRNQLVPVAGTWEVAGVIEGGLLKVQELPEQWKGKDLQFSEDFALLGDNILDKPRYKIKRVDMEEYLFYGHKALPKELNLSEKELKVITVTDKDKFLCEIIKVSSEELVLAIDNESLYLKKISDKVSKRSDMEYREISGSNDMETDTGKGLPKTGVLIGFCSPEKVRNNKESGTYNYRTLWIASTDGQLHPILDMQGILFPRRSGFWRMEAEKDFIAVHPVAAEQKETNTELPAENAMVDAAAGSVTRRIRYVGNDYVSIESREDATSESMLQILPIDSLPAIKGVKLSDLSGGAGAAAMEEGRLKAVEEIKADGGSPMEDRGQDSYFGLERKMGHWFFKGRINYSKDKKLRYFDYNINVIPPAELIFYDELSVPWTEIKDRVPEAVDVFTSPNRDIALVVTRTELIVFAIKNGRLEDKPLGKTAIKAGETVVMAEWATGRYVEAWENSFAGNGT